MRPTDEQMTALLNRVDSQLDAMATERDKAVREIIELKTKIKAFLEAWQVHTEQNGKHIVLRVPGYGEHLGTEYGFDWESNEGEWGKRGEALFDLLESVE